jgi:hypothetical protein
MTWNAQKTRNLGIHRHTAKNKEQFDFMSLLVKNQERYTEKQRAR